MKKCSRCKISKELDQFNKRTLSKDKHGNTCKECVNEYNKLYDFKKWNKDNKERLKEKSLEYYQDNKEHIKNRSKDYFNKDKDRHRIRTKNWHLKNKDYHINKTINWIKNEMKINPVFKLKEILRGRIYSVLIKNKIPKIASTLILLGCTPECFKSYIESLFKPEMNWDNYGTIWEIDHITACSKFDLTDPEQQKECFHYSNMQPLFKTTLIAESFGYANYIGNRNKYNK